GYVPQRPVLDSEVPATVEEIVTTGRLARRGWWRPLHKDDHQQVGHALGSVGLGELARRPLNELSGGQHTRGFVARACRGGALCAPPGGADRGRGRRVAAEVPRLDHAPDRGARRRRAPGLARALGGGLRPRPRRGPEAPGRVRRAAGGARGLGRQPRRAPRGPPALARGPPRMPWPIDALPYPFELGFMQRALVASVVVGVFAPMIGTFVVQKKMSL